METNPTVEPDAPLPSDETSPQTTPTDNPPPEPAGTPVSEIAAESAAAEGLPEPLVEVAEQTEQPAPSEPGEAQAQEEATPEPVSTAHAATEEAPPAPETTETVEAQASQAELNLHRETPEAGEEPQVEGEATQPTPLQESEEEARPEEEAPQETPAEGTLSEASRDALAELATQAQTTRLSPADEERAISLLKEALMDGRAGVVRAIDALQKLPWVIGVNAVTTVWPELKPVFRSQMLAGLVRASNDAARRMRLSLARGLFKQDVPIALKIVVGAAKEMRDRETGTMQPKHAQIFANVLIGRAKPWIAQLPLAEVKPNDADILVHCALLSAFSLPHAPITQMGIIKWAAEAGRLSKLHPIVIEAAQKSLGRWSGKWQNALRKEVTDLPEGFTAVLKAHTKEAGQQPAPEGAESAATEEEIPQPAGPVEPDAETEAAEVVPEGRAPAEEPDAEPAEAPKAEAEPAEEQGEAPGEQPKQRPVYESKTVPRKPQQGQPGQQQQQQQQPPQQQQQGGKGGPTLKDAGVPELLRQLESQFQHLRSELHSTQSKLRQRDEELRRAQKRTVERAAAPIIEGEPTPEELARLNRQLEARNQELQARIEELLADSEARAVSVGAVSGEPVNDPNAQLRTLLGLKIQEDYEDFLALEKESPDIVVQQHYRTVLRHVFEVLTQEGVQFELPKTEGM